MKNLVRTSLIMVVALMIAPVNATPRSDYHAWQEEADRIFNAGDYKAAYSKYLKLAKKGDSFS